MNPCSFWDEYSMIQKFAGGEGHCMRSQLPEAAGWLAERFLLSPDFQEIRRIPAPSPMHHMLCILPPREVLAKQVSCPCFARTTACTPQEGRNRRGGVGQSPPLFSWCHCPCVVPLCLIISCWRTFQPPPAGQGVQQLTQSLLCSARSFLLSCNELY